MTDRRNFRLTLRRMATNYELYLFVLPAVVYIILYCYWPMYGVQIAFKDYRLSLGILGSKWAGLKHFNRLFNTPALWTLIKNTLSLSIYSLVVGFPIPVIFSLFLNQVRVKRFKQLVQTVSYAPHFISTVVMVSMILLFLNGSIGVVNKLLGYIGQGPYDFMTRPKWFSSIYVATGVWQNLGWNSIIYLAALAGVDPELHEAAMIDGANRFRRIWHIDLAGILPTVTIMLILASGSIMTIGFEKVFLMQNPLNLESSEVLSTFVYKIGLLYTQYSYSTALGLFNSLINFAMLVSVNAFAKRLEVEGLW
ncbi:MAG: ABC transporter permease subunit [Bacillota bacterium]|nr:ABC transporter permease subunit [Bacillota bacterium]